jgi:hypothetical protein
MTQESGIFTYIFRGYKALPIYYNPMIAHTSNRKLPRPVVGQCMDNMITHRGLGRAVRLEPPGYKYCFQKRNEISSRKFTDS